eukprot:scaffold20_cov361-Prasinococcus_capsulatus_cf.AAC.10
MLLLCKRIVAVVYVILLGILLYSSSSAQGLQISVDVDTWDDLNLVMHHLQPRELRDVCEVVRALPQGTLALIDEEIQATLDADPDFDEEDDADEDEGGEYEGFDPQADGDDDEDAAELSDGTPADSSQLDDDDDDESGILESCEEIDGETICEQTLDLTQGAMRAREPDVEEEEEEEEEEEDCFTVGDVTICIVQDQDGGPYDMLPTLTQWPTAARAYNSCKD